MSKKPTNLPPIGEGFEDVLGTILSGQESRNFMTEIQVFEFGYYSYRATYDDHAWFVAKDVCAILGIKNVSDTVSSLDDDEKTTIGITDSGSNYKTNILLISESGLYSIIFKSKKPEAKQFRRRVTK